MTTDNWPTGRVAVLMPQLPEHLATPHLLDIYAKRLRANLEGVCPECAATVTMPKRHERRRAEKLGLPPQATMEHSTSCPVGDDGFRRAMRAGQN